MGLRLEQIWTEMRLRGAIIFTICAVRGKVEHLARTRQGVSCACFLHVLFQRYQTPFVIDWT